MSQDRDDSIDKAPTATPGRMTATVLQVLPALGAQGGVERGTVEVAAAIVAAGGRAIVASAGGPLAHELARSGATHVTLPLASKNPFVIQANIDRLMDLIEAEKVDIVHARSRAPAWSAWFAARRTGRRFVTTFHGTYGAANFLKRRYNAVMTYGQRVIAISSFIAGHIRQNYGTAPAKIRIVHRGVDLNRFDPAKVSVERVVALAKDWRLTDGLPVVMLPGRLSRWKGQKVVLEAVALMNRRDFRCVLVGSDQGRTGYREELGAFIERHGLGGVVRFVDHAADMPAAYMLSDVVVSASTDPEAFGRVMAEAHALGRPVIASNHGGAREIVLEGKTGWLVPPGNAEALATALNEALALTPADRERISRDAIAHVRASFTTDLMCARTLAVYAEVLGMEPLA
ncbi:MAG: glycosyltransferase family 4 protein [Magnetospirillum sp. WYHS-4]